MGNVLSFTFLKVTELDSRPMHVIRLDDHLDQF